VLHAYKSFGEVQKRRQELKKRAWQAAARLAQPAAILNVMKDRYRAKELPTALEEQRPSQGSGATDTVRADGCAGGVDAAALRGAMGRGVRQDARAGAGRGAAMHAVLRHVKVSNALKAVSL
jgi:hypothetical protein